MEPGLPQYFRGLALARLLPGEGPSANGPALADAARAEQVIADLEFCSRRVANSCPVAPPRAPGSCPRLRGARRGEAGGGGAPTVRREPVRDGPAADFHEFLVDCADGLWLSAPGTFIPAPNVYVAQSYDFGDFAFIKTAAGIVAIDAGHSPDRVLAAMTFCLKDRRLTVTSPSRMLTSTTLEGRRPCLARTPRSSPRPVPCRSRAAAALCPARVDRNQRQPGLRRRARDLVHQRAQRPRRRRHRFVLLDLVRGGETADALMVYNAASGVLFAGGRGHAYLAVPFFAEGSPEGQVTRIAPESDTDAGPRQAARGRGCSEDTTSGRATSRRSTQTARTQRSTRR